MSDPLDDFEAAEAAKVSVKPPVEIDPLDAFEEQYKTSTATTPAGARRQGARREFEKLHNAGLASSIGYGLARGGTLGMVDRAVGAGTKLGEMAGATDQNPANPNAGQEARSDYLRGEAAAKEAHPAAHFLGELGGGMVPTLATSGLNRFAQAGTLGAAFGAGNTRSNEPTKLLTGAALGAAGGLAAEGTLGWLFRKGTRGAPEREDKAFMREMTRTDAGEGASAMLARNKEELVRERDHLMEWRKDPEVREAARMTKGKGIPVINAKINTYAQENANLYGVLDHAAVTGDPKTRAGLMTSERLASALEAAKNNVGKEAALRLDGIKNDLLDHIVPRMWGGEQVIPTSRLREWLSSVGESAARVPGSLNGTNASKTAKEAEAQAYRIVNEYLDSIGGPDVVKQIRANNEKMSGLLTIRNAMVAKSKKEVLESMGLSQVAEQQTRKLELGAALAAMASGHPAAAVAMAGRPYAQGAVKRGAEAANRYILDPLERTARAGAPGFAGAQQAAQLGRASIEGIPQVMGRTIASPASLQQTFGNPDYRASTEIR